MRMIYGYMYLKIYRIMLKTPSRNAASDSAVIMISIPLLFYILPFIFYLVDLIFGKTNFWIVAVVTLLLAFFIKRANENYFVKGRELEKVIQRFEKESKIISLIGYAIVIAFWFSSFVAFFLLLKFLMP